MTSSDITILAFAIVVAGALIGGGLLVAAGVIAEPLTRWVNVMTTPTETEGEE